MTSRDFVFRRPNGMRGIFVIWLGQMVSGIASGVTFVALPIWILNTARGSGTAIGIWEFFFFGAYLLVIQFAGVLIDRYNHKVMMLVYDVSSLLAVSSLLFLETSGKLELWHLYVAAVVQGIGFAFQSPSYSAAITTMVSKKQYVRANGLMALIYDIPDIFGPVLAGMLVLVIGLRGILALNLIAFVLSIAALLIVEVPSTPHTVEGERSRSRLIKEVVYGIKYILDRPGLLGIELIFLFGNLFSGIALSVAALYPMILLRTGNNTEAVGLIQSAGALAVVATGIYLSMWGGIKGPVRAILLGWIISSLFGLTLLGVGQVVGVWLIAIVIYSVFDPVVNVAIETFLQTKVPPDVQGRVFSAGDFLAQAMIPITPLVAGFLGDQVFEPAMAQGGSLVNLFGWLIGTGPGSGFSLLIFLCGISGLLVGLSGYLVPDIRNVDKAMPDSPTLPSVKTVTQAQVTDAVNRIRVTIGNHRVPGKFITRLAKNVRRLSMKNSQRKRKDTQQIQK
ncbi:MAG TPA: MFS transporter [Anaerolineales bacterium]|nr:MFS transporter [Anaerolineales bacterium]